MNVLNTEIENALNIERESFTEIHTKILRNFIRITLVSATCAIAIFVPYFPEVMSLVGALCLLVVLSLSLFKCDEYLHEHDI